jgi:hypothetical protein
LLGAHTGTITFPEILRRVGVGEEGIPVQSTSVLVGWTYERVLEINE